MKRLKEGVRAIRVWRFWQWFTAARLFVIALALIGIGLGVAGYITAHDGVFEWKTLAQDYAANLSTTLIGFAVAVLVIDSLNEQRTERARKRAIIQQMGSPVLDAALEAVRILKLEGWDKDGSLHGVDLFRANLQEAKLYQADLERADLTLANLQKADLDKANLQNARLWETALRETILWQANLQGATLRGADLESASLAGADLRGAKLDYANLHQANLNVVNLSGASLTGANFIGVTLRAAIFDEDTTLPDRTSWTPGTDMARFTNPDHPNFWKPPENAT